VNRLILIGNGFDLAHGLKTGYNDFILWYVKRCFLNAYKENNYSDTLLEITITPYLDRHRLTIEKLEESLDDCYRQEKFNHLMDNVWFSNRRALDRVEPFEFKIKSNLLKMLFPRCSYYKWVDIENEYYELLKAILNLKIINKRGLELIHEKENKLRDLNHSLAFLISQLQHYLVSLPQPIVISDYMRILTSKIISRDVLGFAGIEAEPESTYILNFNYTNTVELYTNWFSANSQRQVPQINYIHGRLNDETNSLIFGFGDELDDTYHAIEQEKAKGYFNFIKSFWYFKTSNYRNLIKFVESEPYQVFILGHSCGLSDRTMLNMVFEHSNCISIKIFYHGDEKENNYVETTHEIARHFKNKEAMRRKIVSFNQCFRMHQFDDPPQPY